MREPVVIAGRGVVCAAGRGADALAAALRENRDGLTVSRFLGEGYQPHRAGVVDGFPAEGRAFALARAAAEEALSRPPLAHIVPERLALVLSTTKGECGALEALTPSSPPSERAAARLDALARKLADAFHARGPVETVSVACVSGLIAQQQAARIIRSGRADAALVIGVDILSRLVVAGFSALQALDPEGCRPFDRERRGLSPGEGAAAVLLARGDLAPEATITLAGGGSSNDANHLTGPSRDGGGLALALERALAQADLAPEQVDYLHAHGTGTPYNDQMEALAFARVFGPCVPPFASTKGLTGHTLGASGLIETVACLIALEQGFLPGTSRLRAVDPVAPDNLLTAPKLDARPRVIAKAAAGFAGVNAALILQARDHHV